MKKIYSLLFLIFIAPQLDAQTTFQWARQFSGSGAVEAAGIASDPNGYLYVVGNFRQVNDFDPGPGTVNLSPVSAFYTDVFITKLRKHLKADPSIVLETIHGVGFRLNVPE